MLKVVTRKLCSRNENSELQPRSELKGENGKKSEFMYKCVPLIINDATEADSALTLSNHDHH